jgi:uncharacterized protein
MYYKSPSAAENFDEGSEMQRLTDQEKKQLGQLIQEKPPKIGLVGVSGVGKSSTINAMFKTSLPISHTIACTTEFCEIPFELKMRQGAGAGQSVNLVVCDAPGLGEDIRKDPEYIDMYRKNLPSCDIILWIMSARNRAIALDQTYLKNFSDLSKRIVFGISQVDLVEPMNWNPNFPIPSKEQMNYIAEIVSDRSKRLSDTLGRNVDVIPYSNYRRYNLEVLFTNLLQSCAGNRSWIFGGLKNFSFEDGISIKLQEELSKTSFVSNQDKMRFKANSSQDELSQKDSRNPLDNKQSLKWFSFLPSQMQDTLQKIFGSSEIDPALQEAIREIVGRDDIEQNPLNEDELALIQSVLSQEKRKPRKSKN